MRKGADKKKKKKKKKKRRMKKYGRRFTFSKRLKMVKDDNFSFSEKIIFILDFVQVQIYTHFIYNKGDITYISITAFSIFKGILHNLFGEK